MEITGKMKNNNR